MNLRAAVLLGADLSIMGGDPCLVSMARPILPDTDPTLRKKSVSVEVFDDELKSLAEDMAIAMMAKHGLGLAAVQLGCPVRLILVRNNDELLFMVNPVITRALRRDAVEREGCLSVPPSKWKRIARPAKCEAKWQDLNGNPQTGGFSNMIARAVQHEVEHLEGISITDHPTAK